MVYDCASGHVHFGLGVSLKLFTLFRDYSLAGWYGAIIIGLVELAFVINAVRLFILATYTEPGIIPRIPSSKIDYSRTHYVEYKTMEEIATDPAY